MKKVIQQSITLIALLILTSVLPASGQAPPPPDHAQNGNQTSPGGTGCPIDKTEGLIIALVFSLGYCGFTLFRQGRAEKETNSR
jgi:hypothetical protein